jgi:hypothetical protein
MHAAAERCRVAASRFDDAGAQWHLATFSQAAIIENFIDADRNFALAT